LVAVKGDDRRAGGRPAWFCQNPAANAGAVGWLRRHERALAVDPIILGELRFGILLLPGSSRRRRLEQWFQEGVGRLVWLPRDAATAAAHDLTIAARNQRDFAHAGVRLVGPFDAA
jgi:predicted nucleic acid-binding protein